jgi:hypothetical protein
MLYPQTADEIWQVILGISLRIVNPSIACFLLEKLNMVNDVLE